MISRRQIRTNVLSTLYEQELQNENTKKEQATSSLNNSFTLTHSLLSSIWHLAFIIADYAIIYANQRASKHLPTKEDMNVSIKIANNYIVQQLKQNNRFAQCVKDYKIQHIFDIHFVRQIFMVLNETEYYQKYATETIQTEEDDKQMFHYLIHEVLLKNDVVTSLLNEKFINYDNDIDAVSTWTEAILKNPKGYAFDKLISNDKREYAHDLIECYYNKKEILSNIITPKLEGWDPERVALIDMLILHLGVAEMLFFPTIPLKVTINEYIDLAKQFSTLQSGQFVNGLLDNVRKELEQQNKIHKTEIQRNTKK